MKTKIHKHKKAIRMNGSKKLFLAAMVSFSFLNCNSTQKIVAAEPSRTVENSAVRSPEQGLPVPHGIGFFKDYMDESYTNLEKAVKGLTPGQLAFKPSEDRWSIAECLEHIVLTEPELTEYEKAIMAAPANPEKRNEVKLTDDKVMSMMLDRSHKAKASENITPHGKYTESETALADLKRQRVDIMQYVNTLSMEDLRNHITDSPMGKIDAYQFLLFIPGHTMRHTLQILEVKTDPNFPKN